MPTDSQMFIWIDSETAARNFYIPPGTTMFFMDKQVPKLYAKDSSGFRIFNLVEEFPQPEPTQQMAYVTQTDLMSAMEDLKSYIDGAVKKRTRTPKEA